MKKLIVLALCLVLALAVGCASNTGQIPATDNAGNLLYTTTKTTDPKTGQVTETKAPVMSDYNLDDSAHHGKMQMEAAKLKKPIMAMKAGTITTTTYEYDDKGNPTSKKVVESQAPIVLSGIKEFYVWGPNGMTSIKQYQNPWAGLGRELIRQMPLGLSIYTAYRASDAWASAERASVTTWNLDNMQVDSRGSNVNIGRGTQVGGASTTQVSGESSGTGGSTPVDYNWTDSSSSNETSTNSLGGIGN